MAKEEDQLIEMLYDQLSDKDIIIEALKNKIYELQAIIDDMSEFIAELEHKERIKDYEQIAKDVCE